MKNGLDEQYIDLLKDILENGVEKNTRNGKVLSVFGRTIRYKFKDGKFPLLTTKKMHTKGIITELIWFLRGDTNIKYLVENDCNIWNGDCYKSYQGKQLKSFPAEPDSNLTKEEFINKIKTDDEFAKKWGDLGSIYGKQWRNWKTYDFSIDNVFGDNEFGGGWNVKEIDQIANLIHDLKNNPDSRRLMVNAWNVGEIDDMVLPPCHYGFQCYTRKLTQRERILYWHDNSGDNIFPEGNIDDENLNKLGVPKRALSLKWQQRSCDFPLGIPYNIASYGFLLEILAKKVNMVPDELIGDLGDCHIYLNQIEGCEEQITREGFDLPKIRLSNDFDWFNYDLDQMIEWMSQKVSDWVDISDYVSHSTIKFPLSN